jgi:hypothetical protein
VGEGQVGMQRQEMLVSESKMADLKMFGWLGRCGWVGWMMRTRPIWPGGSWG